MSEEIIDEYKNIIYSVRDEKINLNDELNRENIYRILWRFLDLYNKEKEKNKELENKIKGKIEELQAMYDKLPKNPKEHLHSKTEYKIVIGELQELLEERN